MVTTIEDNDHIEDNGLNGCCHRKKRKKSDHLFINYHYFFLDGFQFLSDKEILPI